MAIAYYQAGEIHHLLKDNAAAIDYYYKGAHFSDKEEGINARMLNGIATVYMDDEKYELAYEYFQQSLKQIEGKNNFILESKNYADIGNYYFRKGDFDQALAFQQKSIRLRLENKLSSPLITNYLELAELFLKQGDFGEALRNALMAEKMALELNIVIKLYQAHRILSSIYELKGEAGLALEHFKKYHQFRNEVLNQESARKIKQLSMHHEMESMQQEKEIFQLRNVELKSALDELGASVRYARRIQEAILPSASNFKTCLPDSFVLYKPKDIVAGDFYWIERVGDLVLFAAADCTGHGVPGALVSVVCSNALNRAVIEYKLTDPGELLDKTRELILEQFAKSEEEVNDGMDISLCAFNSLNQTMLWGGANNPLWIVRKGELLEFKPDKQPIGKHVELKSFTTRKINLEKDDTIYVFTDGFHDQFGGERGKKFKSSAMKGLLLSIQGKSMEQQKMLVNQSFENWKGDFEQVDDVCIIGVKCR